MTGKKMPAIDRTGTHDTPVDTVELNGQAPAYDPFDPEVLKTAEPA